MPYDANNILQTLVTKTASFSSTGFNLVTGTPRRGMTARFLINSYASTISAGSTFLCKIQESDDDTTYTDLAMAPPLTGATAAATAEVFVPFSTVKKYVRSVITVTSAATSTNSITYLVDLGIARP